MICIVCGKEIDTTNLSEYEHLCNGDFIHNKCKPRWNKFCDMINNMTNDEFSSWIGGE